MGIRIKEDKNSNANKVHSSYSQYVISFPPDGLITIDTGVKIRALNEETKKTNDISRRAAEFRQQALYGGNKRRMPSKWL